MPFYCPKCDGNLLERVRSFIQNCSKVMFNNFARAVTSHEEYKICKCGCGECKCANLIRNKTKRKPNIFCDTFDLGLELSQWIDHLTFV